MEYFTADFLKRYLKMMEVKSAAVSGDRVFDSLALNADEFCVLATIGAEGDEAQSRGAGQEE
jgi:hypothetical protein